MAYFGTRLVLVERDGKAAEQEVEGYAAGFDWPRVVSPVDGSIESESTWDMAGVGALHLLRDEATDRRYVYVVTETRNLGEAFSADLARRLRVVSRGDLLSGWDRATDPEQQREAILLLALGGPHAVDDEIFDRIQRALTDPDPSVRIAGLDAMLYTPLRTYRPALRQVAESDPDPRVSGEAIDVLSVFDEIGVPTE